MPPCPNCLERNPATITYSKAVPLINVNCSECGSPFFIPSVASSGNGKTTEIIEGSQISVNDISDSLVDRFIVAFDPHIAMTVALTMVPKALTVPQGSIILFGTVIDEVNLSWVYSKPADVSAQDLTNDGGLSVPTLTLIAVTYDYTGQNIQADVQFTITGNDGLGLPESIGTDIKSIAFGNYRGWGKGVRLDSGSEAVATLITFIEGLIAGAGTKELTTTRSKSPLTGEGVVLEHFYYFFPKAWGFAIFTQNGIPGGMKRLGNVGGLVTVVPLDAYDGGESDILIDNGLSAEAFHIYQSTSDNIVGAVFAVG